MVRVTSKSKQVQCFDCSSGVVKVNSGRSSERANLYKMWVGLVKKNRFLGSISVICRIMSEGFCNIEADWQFLFSLTLICANTQRSIS